MSTDRSVEEIVKAAWCSVLGVEVASPDDDFFESGGHSFAAMQLMTKVEAALPISFPLDLLFDGPLKTVIEECETRLGTKAS
ncbi:phosphopantetheine-binding protein [Streptomyces niveus]|uniref:phosphopantetheine-binding protein n=1 Tax=Streptomyces niveus TaxID=193462 RepID=UPI0036BD6589